MAPRRRVHDTDPLTRYRNMLETRGRPGMGGKSRLGAVATEAVVQSESRTGEPWLAVIDAGEGQVPSGYTKAFWIPRQSQLRKVTGTLSSVGDSDVTAQVLRSGAVLTTLTIPAGATAASVSVGELFTAGSTWQMNQTATGSPASGLSFFGEFS